MSWGDESHYYSKQPQQVARVDGVARLWQQELTSANAHARTDVVRAVKQWNNAVREHLRNETGLRISMTGDIRSVPVRVVDGLPPPVQQLLQGLPELAFLLLRVSEIEQARRGTAVVAAEYSKIARLVPDVVQCARHEEVEHTHSLAVSLLAKLDELKFGDKWKAFKEDLLGAYFFRRPVIHIYWVPIGLVAAGL